MKAQTEDRAPYHAAPAPQQDEDAIIAQALEILSRRLYREPVVFDNPDAVRNYLTLKYAALEHEEFGVVWLDARNHVIREGTLFRGTLTQASVYPREVVKEALACNAAGAILYHNHPSGNARPSHADELLTRALKSALDLVDVRVLDHLIVAGTAKPASFAELGLL